MSGLVSDAQLNALRTVGYKQLVTPFTVWRTTQVENTMGFDPVLTQVDSSEGWIRMMNQPRTDEEAGMREGATAVFRLHMRVGVNIANGDEVRCFGNRYQVQDVNEDDTVVVFRTAMLRRIQ